MEQIIYTKDLYDDEVIKAYGLLISEQGNLLDRAFIGSQITVDENDRVHSYNDHPAIITPDGSMFWCKMGILHRDNGPAVVMNDGTFIWFNKGKIHREDGPAFINNVGDLVWFKNGRPHRSKDPAAIYSDGALEWYSFGDLHKVVEPDEIR